VNDDSEPAILAIEVIVMQLLALLALGLSGLVMGGVGTNTSMIDVSAASHFDAPFVGVPSAGGIFVPIHKPSHFPFGVIVPDDGQGKAGGWQAAKANLPFQKIDFPALITWYCPLTIGMPIRHRIRGYISPASAAAMSAAVTNSVASSMNFDLPQGVFCHKFYLGVEAAFPLMQPGLGATVSQ
jgi:hypothetical protein